MDNTNEKSHASDDKNKKDEYPAIVDNNVTGTVSDLGKSEDPWFYYYDKTILRVSAVWYRTPSSYDLLSKLLFLSDRVHFLRRL